MSDTTHKHEQSSVIFRLRGKHNFVRLLFLSSVLLMVITFPLLLVDCRNVTVCQYNAIINIMSGLTVLLVNMFFASKSQHRWSKVALLIVSFGGFVQALFGIVVFYP